LFPKNSTIEREKRAGKFYSVIFLTYYFLVKLSEKHRNHFYITTLSQCLELWSMLCRGVSYTPKNVCKSPSQKQIRVISGQLSIVFIIKDYLPSGERRLFIQMR